MIRHSTVRSNVVEPTILTSLFRSLDVLRRIYRLDPLSTIFLTMADFWTLQPNTNSAHGAGNERDGLDGNEPLTAPGKPATFSFSPYRQRILSVVIRASPARAAHFSRE